MRPKKRYYLWLEPSNAIPSVYCATYAVLTTFGDVPSAMCQCLMLFGTLLLSPTPTATACLT